MSELWRQEIRRVVDKKKECFLIWSSPWREEDLEKYRRKKRGLKGWYEKEGREKTF